MAVNLINSNDITISQDNADIQLNLTKQIPTIDSTISTSSTNGIENQAITNYVNGINNYSPSTEIVIGTYNGKPLYRIELSEVAITGTSQATDVSSYNIDELVNLNSRYKEYSSGTDYNGDFGNYYISSSDYRRTFFRTLNNGATKSLEYRGKATGVVIYTMEYTKTTD